MERKHLEFRPQEVITDVLDQEKHVVDILVETQLKGEEGLIQLFTHKFVVHPMKG
jgi:hypothetical protein